MQQPLHRIFLPFVPTTAVVEAMSSRIIGGVQVGGGDGTVEARAIANTPGNENGGGREAVGGDEAVEERPNVVIVVLESTRGAFVTPADDVGVSPWAKKLSERWVLRQKDSSSRMDTPRGFELALSHLLVDVNKLVGVAVVIGNHFDVAQDCAREQ